MIGTVKQKVYEETFYSGQGWYEDYQFEVAGHEFEIPEECFGWLNQDDKVVVEYYPHNKRPIKVTRTRAGGKPGVFMTKTSRMW